MSKIEGSNEFVVLPGSISNLPELSQSDQLCAALDISRSTLWRLHRDDNGPKRIVIGRTVLYEKADVIAWLASRKRTGL